MNLADDEPFAGAGLARLYADLMSDDVAAAPADEQWPDLIERISVPGRIHEVTEEIY